ncbi:MAG TPA: 2-phospho-L-lactate guanylyltransferase [Micromonosporaceae bacterium]
MHDQAWTVVVPLKPLDAAKSRLRGAVPGSVHARLALALAQDTVAAVTAAEPVTSVIVVTSDPVAAAALTRLGARVVPDRPAEGLNAAVAIGAAGLAGPVAALAADLPALRPAELTEALVEAGGRRVFVADLAGTGTTMLAAPAGAVLRPLFGVDSAARHAASGAVPLGGAWPGLRRDVDTADDLTAARALGVGRYTAAVLDEVAASRR